MAPKIINLQDLIPKYWGRPSLLLTVDWRVRLQENGGLTVTIATQDTSIRTGRPLKPQHVITIMDTNQQGLPRLLRMLATAFEQGDVEVYDPPDGDQWMAPNEDPNEDQAPGP